jgi:hypothetical protein
VSDQDEGFWAVLQFRRADEQLVKQWDLPGVRTSEVRTAFEDAPEEFPDETPGGDHLITEAQRNFFERLIGEPLDLTQFDYFTCIYGPTQKN